MVGKKLMGKLEFTISVLIQCLFIMIMSSCGDTEYEYSSSPCYLIIDNSLHHDATLASAMTRYSGTFVVVSTTSKAGAKYFSFANNYGVHTESVFNAYDDRRSLVVGKNNGIIIGYGNSVDGILYAYDRECPNCFNENALPMKSRPLSVSEAGIATCGNCKRRYDLNNGGFISEGDKGNKLTRYRCSSTGAYGILNVN